MYITANRIAAEMGVSLRTAYEWMRTMKHFRHGRTIRVALATFESWKRNRELEGCRSDDPQHEPSGENSGDESALTAPSETITGQTSSASELRQVSRALRRRSAGKTLDSSKEPIHVARPPKRQPSRTP